MVPKSQDRFAYQVGLISGKVGVVSGELPNAEADDQNHDGRKNQQPEGYRRVDRVSSPRADQEDDGQGPARNEILEDSLNSWHSG